MSTYRKQAIVIGTLFILATAAPILSGLFINFLSAPDYLAKVASNAVQVKIGLVLEFIMSIAIAGIAIALYPVLKKRNESLALGYVGIRIFEGVLFMVMAVSSLALLATVSQEFVNAGDQSASYYLSLGSLLVAAHDWSYLLSGLLVFSLGALALNYMLLKSKLVPLFISIWGLIGAMWLLAGALLILFGLIDEDSSTFVFLPLAVQEMVLAVWLIVKGFNKSPIVFQSVENGAS